MEEKKSKFGFGLLLGVVAGVVAGLFASNKPGKKLRKKTQEEYENLKKLLKEDDIETVLKNIFGEATDEVKKVFSSTKDDVAKSLVELKVRFNKVEKEKYKKVVAEAVEKVKKEQKFPEKTLSKLKKYLDADYSKLTSKKKSS